MRNTSVVIINSTKEAVLRHDSDFQMIQSHVMFTWIQNDWSLRSNYHYQWRIQDFPLWGGADPLGGTNLRRIHFSVETYAKTKEIDPVGGGGGACRRRPPLDPPMIATTGSRLRVDMKCNLSHLHESFSVL